MSALQRQAWATNEQAMFAPFGTTTTGTGATGPTGPTGAQGVPGNSAGRIYYFNRSGGTDELDLAPLFAPGQDIIVSANGPAAAFLTPVGEPDVALVPGGNFTFSINAKWNTTFAALVPQLYVEVYMDTTLIGTDQVTPNDLFLANTQNDYIFTVAIGNSITLVTDRMRIILYIQNLDTANGDTVTLFFEDDTVAQVITTLGAFALPGPTGPAGPTGPTGAASTVTGPTGPPGTGANAAQWATFPAVQGVNMSNFNVFNAANISATQSNLNLSATSNVTVVGEGVGIRADQGIDLASFSDLNLIAQNGNRGRINLTANPGDGNGVQGEIRLVANGGNVGGLLGPSTGGLIELTANTPIGIPTLTSAIKLTGESVVSYAGVTSPFGSLAGYNFLYGTNGVNIAAGTPPVFPNLIGSIYLNGNVGAGGGGGVRVQNGIAADYIVPFPTGTGSPPDLFIQSNGAGQLVTMSGVRQITMSDIASLNNVSNINAVGIGAYSNVNWANNKAIANLDMSGNSIVNLGNLNGSALSTYSNVNWANNKAIANLDMSGNSIINATQVNGTTLYEYGVFESSVTQTVSAANTPTNLSFNNEPLTDPNSTISLSAGTIRTSLGGDYEFNVSVQLDKTGPGISPCDIWLRSASGVDYPNTGNQITIQGNTGETLATFSTMLRLTPGPASITVCIASSDATMAATAFPAITSPYTRPAIPSVIVTVKLLKEL